MNKYTRLLCYSGCFLLVIFFSGLFSFRSFSQGEIKTLEIGAKAPEFNLPGVDDKTYSLSDLIITSLDSPKKQDEVLSFLKKQEASNVNYLYDSTNKYPFIEAVDKNWQGPIPYTLLIDPEGQIVYSKQSEMDPLTVKRTIVNILGREKDW